MVNIRFKYKDQYSRGEWAFQDCTCDSLADCIKWYGLDQPDVEYEIISITPVKED